MKVKICEASIQQINIIQDIALRTWPTAFKDILSAEQIKYMLEWMYSTEKLKLQIQQQGINFYLPLPKAIIWVLQVIK